MNLNEDTKIYGNILIIDDTPENLQLLAQTLSEKGYTVRGAVKGQMGIKAAQNSPPDLILLDIKMPDLDGYEVCKLLKADAKTKNIPVIFLSALDDVWDKVKGFQIGGVDYITKPFQVEEVLVRVENQLLICQLNKQLLEKSQQLQIQNQQLQQEIIERRKAEKAAEAASRAKSEFVANMSHELRTPLNLILGFTQILGHDSLLTQEQRNYLEIISRSGEHLLELIDDVLELSRIEAGKQSLNPSVFDFYYFLDCLEELFQVKAEEKGLYLTFYISPDVPQYIKTDQQKLRCCLLNLIGNALKFTQSGSVALRVSLIKDNYNQTSIHFEVEDTGPGIPPTEINHVFKAFAQTETGRKEIEGVGLGLAISQRFVQLMGGQITVNSTVGKGTTFLFDINLVSFEEAEIVVTPRQQVIGLEPNQKHYKILVVDDTKENRLLLVKLLEPVGFEVQEAENGQEAVEKWLSFQPDLIWMDTRMPVMDGIQATKEIRAMETKKAVTTPSLYTRGTVIIALTASFFEEKKAEILAAGSDDFLRKPFAEEALFEKMAQLLNIRYIYESLPPSNLVNRKLKAFHQKLDSFILEKMVVMPAIWIGELQQAAKNFDEDLVNQLIRQIPENNAELAEALKELLKEFRLDIIYQITQLFFKR